MDSDKRGWSRIEKKHLRLPNNSWLLVAQVCELNEDAMRKVNTVYLKNLSRVDIFYNIVGKGVAHNPGVLKGKAREVLHVCSDRGNVVLAVLTAPELTRWKSYTMCNLILYTDLFMEPKPKVLPPLQAASSENGHVKRNGHVHFEALDEEESDSKILETAEMKAAAMSVAMQALETNEMPVEQVDNGVDDKPMGITVPTEGPEKNGEESRCCRGAKAFFMRFIRRFF